MIPTLSATHTIWRGTVLGGTLDDGATIMGYDAILTALAAIRSSEGINDTPDLVAQQFKRMHGTEAVSGASGWISLSQAGESMNKAVPILQVRPDGQVNFIQLSSPLGSPCVPKVPPC